MNGVHDMGGMDGFGKVEVERDEPVFHADWEARTMALVRAMGAAGAFNIDTSRFYREALPPHVYLQRFRPTNIAAWKNLVPMQPGESPDVILRQAASAQSIFRGVVRVDGLVACDVIQVWLDVSEHPSRGAEQADLIWNRVLKSVTKATSLRF